MTLTSLVKNMKTYKTFLGLQYQLKELFESLTSSLMSQKSHSVKSQVQKPKSQVKSQSPSLSG